MSLKTGVFEGITKNQIDQLIKLTKSDPIVQRCTHDPERFKNKKTFNAWRKGKTIYSLTDAKGNLLGLSWFGKKKNLLAPNTFYTFAIRIYPPVRGKGYALRFMKEAFYKFKPKSVWLSTRRNNIPAIKLYKKFGFKKLGEDESDRRVYFITP